MILEKVRKLREQALSLSSDTGRPRDMLVGLGVGFVSGVLQSQNLTTARQLVSDGWLFPHLGHAFLEEGSVRGTQLPAHFLQARCDEGVLGIADTALIAQQFNALAEVGQAKWADMPREYPLQATIAQPVKSVVRLFMPRYVQ